MDFVAFLPQSETHWPGRVSSVVFCLGCNFKCGYCFNYPLVLFPKRLPTISEEKFFRELKENVWSLDGVVVTGGEPTLQGQKLRHFLEDVQLNGLLTKIETNGSNPQILKELLELRLVDSVSLDIKGSLESKRYSELTGKTNYLKNVIESIYLLQDSGIDHEFVLTFVPGQHTAKEVLGVTNFLNGSPRFVLQQFRAASGTLHPRFEKIRDTDKRVLLNVAKKVSGIKEVRIRTAFGDEIVSLAKGMELLK